MTRYIVDVELDERDLSEDRALELGAILTPHAVDGILPGVSSTDDGWVHLRLTAGNTVHHALEAARSIVSHTSGREPRRVAIALEDVAAAAGGIPPLYSAAEAAEELGLTKMQVTRLCNDGTFRSAVRVGERWVIAQREVEARLRLKSADRAGRAAE